MKHILSLSILCHRVLSDTIAQDSLSSVSLDQEGFYPKAPKITVVTDGFEWNHIL
jgi:hypothetical protein